MVDSFIGNLVDQINYVRMNPKDFANKLLSYENNFKDKVFKIQGQTAIMTNEGFPAFREAADFLLKCKTLGPVILNNHMTKIAEDALAITKDSSTEHAVDLDKLISKYGQIVGVFSEAIDFGSSTPEMVVINLIVDDGDVNRGNRNNLMNPKFKLCGIANGTHKTYKHMTVITYARHFFAKGEEIGALSDDNYEDNQQQETKGKPRVSIKKEYHHEEDKIAYDDFDIPEGVVKIDKEEKIVEEGGKKKKIIKITKHMEDGSIQTEVSKVNL
jgi:hypothetical protein